MIHERDTRFICIRVLVKEDFSEVDPVFWPESNGGCDIYSL